MSAFVNALLNILLVVCSTFLICLILIQRGKGGGLAGAFGGVGGSSAFGTKAGDVFTRVTIIVAGVWIVLAMMLVIINNRPRASAFQAAGASSSEVPLSTKSGPAPKVKVDAGGPASKPAGSNAPAAPTNPDLPPAIPDEPASKSKTP